MNDKPVTPRGRSLLHYDFTAPTGTALLLTSHYYFTGRSGNSNDVILTDPIDQLKWTRNNLPYFSAVAKQINVIRNILVHNGYLSQANLAKLHRVLSNLNTKNPGNSLIAHLINLVEIVLSENDAFHKCKFCGSILENDQIDENPDPEVQRYLSLEEIKKDEKMKEVIKGKKVKMVTGKYYGQEGMFRSWSGTKCFIDFPNTGRTSISVSGTTIEVNF